MSASGGKDVGSGGALLERGRALVRTGIAAALPWLVRRSLRRGLAGVWVREEMRPIRPGTLLAPNHHSWWDAYLVWLVAQRTELPLAAMMDDAQLARFPFFAPHGAIARSRPRELLRRLEEGHLGVVFPEGRLRPAGAPGDLAPGAARLARMAGAPLRPLAIRVTLRGLARPEAYLSLGPTVDGPDALAEALHAELAAVDRDLDAAEAEEVPPGYTTWLRGADAPDRRSRGREHWWR